MTMLINCRCGYRTEIECDDRVQAEVVADRHETQDQRRAYRHDTMLQEVR